MLRTQFLQRVAHEGGHCTGGRLPRGTLWEQSKSTARSTRVSRQRISLVARAFTLMPNPLGTNPYALSPKDLSNRAEWPQIFREVIRLREDVYRAPTGCHTVKFDSLAELDDLRSVFIVMVDEATERVVHAFRATACDRTVAGSTLPHIFDRWSMHRWLPPSDFVALTRGCTIDSEKYRRRHVYDVSLALMDLLVHAAGYNTALVMLGTEMPRGLLEMFSRNGFRELQVRRLLSEGTLDASEQKHGALWTNPGYEENILLKPYRSDLQPHRLLAALCHAVQAATDANVSLSVDMRTFLHAAVDFARTCKTCDRCTA